MKQNRGKMIFGGVLFLFAIGFFCVQMGYFYAHARFQIEYVDNRLFYMINIMCVICLIAAVFLLLKLTKWFKLIGASVAVLFMITNGILLVNSKEEIKNITSLSPNFKNVLSIKENIKNGESIYYRSYFGILARPKERLPYEAGGEFKVEWLAEDVAAVTYKASDQSIQQFIGTYGDRGSGRSYYYVGAEIQGQWHGENAEVVSDTEGISVTQNGETELFGWEDIEQFGTLAVVLKKNNEAAWTISLNENFAMYSNASKPTEGEITLYKATMEHNQPIILVLRHSN